MSGHCSFCQIWHSGGCFHPGRSAIAALEQQVAELTKERDAWAKKAWLAAHDVGFFSMWNGTDHTGPPKLALLCNDTFAWATADCEDVLDTQLDEIIALYRHEGEAGVIRWIAAKRDMKPIRDIEKWLTGCDAIRAERDQLQAALAMGLAILMFLLILRVVIYVWSHWW